MSNEHFSQGPLSASVPAQQQMDDIEAKLEAARKATRASRRAMATVAEVMSDEVPRTDEEIWAACQGRGQRTSLDWVRHGRLALAEAGELVPTGETRRTKLGVQARLWRVPRREIRE